jgi:hypothetical protein
MRFTTQLLLGLGLIFATMLAVEGLPQTSPTASPSPQIKESPAKQQQTAKKKGFWPWSKREKATPAPSTTPTVVVGKPKRQKKENVDIPAEGPVAIPTPRAPRESIARPTPYMIGVRESATPAPGGVVWVNTKTHVYHSQRSRWYGTTKEGKYMSEEEAKADGNRPARTNE